VTKSRFLVVALNLCLFSLFAYWLIANIDFNTLLNQFFLIPIWATVGATAIYLVALLLYGLRMALLLDCRISQGCKVTTLGYALNTVMPFRLGELLKILLTNQLWGFGKTQVISASAMEKLCDLSKLIFFTGLIVVAGGLWPIPLTAAVSLAAVIAAAVLCIILGRIHISKIIRWMPKYRGLRRTVIEFHKHTGSYPLVWIAIVTSGIWVVNVALIAFSINSFLPQAGLSFSNAAILYFILSLAVAVPSAPAGIGLFEAATIAFVSGVSEVGYEASLAAATVLHAVISLPQLLFCIPLLWSYITRNSVTPESEKFKPTSRPLG
jgi:uncharacterized membrane protein YbhN (UPF0104 family)